jgi:6,7-dimethyl-8-ribityllumazine synthase
MPEITGKISARGRKLALVVSRFNGTVTKRLLDGAMDAVDQHGGNRGNVDVVWVSGSFEIPIVMRKLAQSKKKYDGIAALGAVIRGDTPHFDYVASEVTRGIGRVAAEFPVPVSFGIITADTLEQAMERSGGKQGNKGRQAVLNLLETIAVLEQI